jgi:hypothetical protein
MSTTPRVGSSVAGAEPGFRTVFGHRAELFAAFGELYGRFWSHGVLDHPTKEIVRLRNARITDCGY